MSREHFIHSCANNTSFCKNFLNPGSEKTWSVDDRDKKYWIEVRFQSLLSISQIEIDGSVKIVEIKSAPNETKATPRNSLMGRNTVEFIPAIIVSSLNITISKNKKELSAISITDIHFYGSTGKNRFKIAITTRAYGYELRILN